MINWHLTISEKQYCSTADVKASIAIISTQKRQRMDNHFKSYRKTSSILLAFKCRNKLRITHNLIKNKILKILSILLCLGGFLEQCSVVFRQLDQISTFDRKLNQWWSIVKVFGRQQPSDKRKYFFETWSRNKENITG
jgi:hypothetical protein